MNKLCLKILQKNIKMAITVNKFSKFFRGSMLPDLFTLLLLLKLLIINFAGKKLRLKKVRKFGAPP